MIFRLGAPLSASVLLAALLVGGCGILPGLGTVGGSALPNPSRPGEGGAVASPAGREADSPAAKTDIEKVDPAGKKALIPQGKEGGGKGVSKEKAPSFFSGKMCGGDLLVDEGGKGDPVLASVDGRKIRSSDLYRTFFLENPVRTRNALKNEILYILTREESRRLGVEVGWDEVEKVLEKTIADHRARCAAYIDESIDLEDFIRTQYRMSFKDYRAVLGRTALFNLLLDRLVRYTEMGLKRIQVGVIVVKEKEKAEEIRKKLLDGANFEVLARKNSLDRSAAEGGILAPIPLDFRHPLFPLVEKAASAKPGSVLDVEEVSLPKEKLYRIVKVFNALEPISGSYREEVAAVEKSLAENPVDLAAIQFWEACQKERHEIVVEDS